MKLTLTIKLTPAQLAEAFCEMDDEDQAQVFIEAARIARGWDAPPAVQWSRVGGHLRTCSCSSADARALVRGLADGLEGIT
jgi:hypothetical protein